MTEPWDLKTDNSREADSLPTFIVFCEDEISEPVYFKFFETALIKVNLVEKQRSKLENVVKAIKHCVSQELMHYDAGKLVLKSEPTHVWCVFDRDYVKSDESLSEEDVKFNAAINTAIDSGIKVAWSNDAFELWVLLHFMEIDPKDEKFSTRQTYYDLLTDIFKNHKNPNDDLKKAIAHKSFNYKQDLKNKNNFRSIVRPELIKRTEVAISRAKELERFFNEQESPHKKVPCTMVHNLVNELLDLGKKSLEV